MNEHLNLDVAGDEARALHRVVRAMHDGHCPNCGVIHPADSMRYDSGIATGWRCPDCYFRIDDDEARAALQQFRPYLERSVAIFEAWRAVRANPVGGGSP